MCYISREIKFGLGIVVVMVIMALFSFSLAWSQATESGNKASAEGEIQKKDKVVGWSREIVESQKPLYWYDGEARRPIWVDKTLYAILPKGETQDERNVNMQSIENTGRLVTADSTTAIVEKGDSGFFEANDVGDYGPVFRDQSGQILALPGGVILFFNKNLTETEIKKFFRDKNIPSDRYNKNPNLSNFYVVDTEPGFPSLELANELSLSPELLVSSPNWWQRVEAQ